MDVQEDPDEGNKPRGPMIEALEDPIRVMKSTVVTAIRKLYHSDDKGKMMFLKLFQVLKHNSLRKLHVHNIIFI